jgi:ubiquinone/menaquinone biosynthesis C-methylase UbiE
MRLLDCGSGPGTITIGLAQQVAPGMVTGIDLSVEQCEIATRNARDAGVENIRFQPSLVYSLPFPDAHFDAVFAHALFEHLAEPQRAAKEIFRVLKPGGVVGLRAPDWGGFLLEPDTPEVQSALNCYAEFQSHNGGTPHAGRKLCGWLRNAGFDDINPSMNGQCYVDATQPAEYLALRLDAAATAGELPAAEAALHAAALRKWGSIPHALFLQIWCEAIAFRPPVTPPAR